MATLMLRAKIDVVVASMTMTATMPGLVEAAVSHVARLEMVCMVCSWVGC